MLQNRYDVISPPWVVRFGRNSAAWCRITRRLWRYGRDRNRKWYSNMANFCFSKPEIAVKFGLLIDFDLLNTMTSTNAKPEIVLSGRSHHLEKSTWCHITAVDGTIWTKFNSLTQNNTAIMVKWSKMKPEV